MMAYVVMFLATRWGSELGGLNVFNTGLARGMSQILPKGGRCVCYVERLPAEAHQEEGIVLRVLPSDERELSEDIGRICSEFEDGTLQGLLVVGHDSKTGKLAIDSANLLKPLLSPTQVLSAVVSHMDYFEYGQKKGHSPQQVRDRSKAQQHTVASADLAFAVGPLLQASFQSARTVDDRRARPPVKRLLPGAAEIAHEAQNERPGLNVFISGRLALEDDTIKNGVLAIEALLEAYRRGRSSDQKMWTYRGKLFACGVDPERDRGLLAALEERARQETAFEIQAIPFTNQQADIYQYLASSHFALMPSWHEGFGLAGWEALCAGVPLICSRQSGLAMLLDELRQQLPDVSFHSIEYVNLAGSAVPGKPTPHDIQMLVEAIDRITVDLPKRKRDAVILAKRLKRDFTWHRTAIELFDETKWVLPNSVRWRARQQFASRAASGSQTDPHASEVIAHVMELLDRIDIDRDWSDLCSAFNYLSDVGKQVQLTVRRVLFEQLREIGQAVERALPQLADQVSAGAIRDSGCLDVCWRYMAASASISESFGQYAELLEGPLHEVICAEPFLRKEMLHYASRFSHEFPHSANAVAKSFFDRYRRILDQDPNLQIRLARLSSVYPEWSHVLPDDDGHAARRAEWDRCTRLKAQPYDVGALIHEDPKLVPTILALMSLRSDPARQLADQAVGFFNDYQGTTIQALWRGDKRLHAGLVSTGVVTSKLLDVLLAMAVDEDETIRWAALDLAFSRTLRARLDAAGRVEPRACAEPLNQVLGRVVDLAVRTDAGHPWLHREYLQHYQQEQATQRASSPCARFTISDFPVARHLFGGVIGEVDPTLLGSQHPEVRAARADAQARVKRVLFVLPPIEVPGESGSHHASYTSTPPLGLGLVATHAAQLGHDVQLADCHRYPELCKSVTEMASSFDLIGLNTVLSTLRSTVELLKKVRRRTFRTLLVVGGPVVKADAWRHCLTDPEERACWDFAIANAALENISKLLLEMDAQSPWPSSRSLIANTLSPILASRDIRASLEQIDLPKTPEPEWAHVHIDRRLFTGPSGQYEPARTRSMTRTIPEAHVVMSQGCDWNCVFCTERRALSGGETRRPVRSVVHELRQLFSAHRDLRIQFIDDNLLPQIATINPKNRVMRAAAVSWAEEFLKELESFHQSCESSGWRGIFRLEDFFEYEREFKGTAFVELLMSSGCRMLAFGIEHGDEDRRRRLKTGEGIQNERITELFGRLRQAGIHTKAYFMIGGRWEQRATAEKTIEFAIASGVTLAYFALYKDFVQASSVLSQQKAANRAGRSNAYLDYDQLSIRWDEAFAVSEADAAAAAQGGWLVRPISPSERDTYRQLSALGFRFEHLVKYNDYHSDAGESSKLLRDIAWDDPQGYFEIVEQAYRSFYLRPRFVDDYPRLIESGY